MRLKTIANRDDTKILFPVSAAVIFSSAKNLFYDDKRINCQILI